MENIKIYTHYSRSHETFYTTYFKPSLRNLYTKDEVTIRLLKQHQYTDSGFFLEPGWLDAMQEKIQIVLTAIEENWNRWFIFSDVDVQFFKPFLHILEEELKSVDIVAQEDIETLCAGFFACKGNQTMKDVFTKVMETFRVIGNDQAALNKLRPEYKFKYLDKDKFYTIGNFLDRKYPIWDNKTLPIVPKDIHVHHANFVLGVYEKYRLMDLVRNEVMRQKDENLVR